MPSTGNQCAGRTQRVRPSCGRSQPRGRRPPTPWRTETAILRPNGAGSETTQARPDRLGSIGEVSGPRNFRGLSLSLRLQYENKLKNRVWRITAIEFVTDFDNLWVWKGGHNGITSAMTTSCRLVVACDFAGIMLGPVTNTGIIPRIRQCSRRGCTAWTNTITTRDVVSCQADQPLQDVWSVMKQEGLQRIPVIG